MNVSRELTGACWTYYFTPLQYSRKKNCIDNLTKQECDDQGGVKISTIWTPGAQCDDTQPTDLNESRACILSPEYINGFCIDEFPEIVYGKPYNMSQILCEKLADLVKSPSPNT